VLLKSFRIVVANATPKAITIMVSGIPDTSKTTVVSLTANVKEDEKLIVSQNRNEIPRHSGQVRKNCKCPESSSGK
jgi:hypothetical protein